MCKKLQRNHAEHRQQKTYVFGHNQLRNLQENDKFLLRQKPTIACSFIIVKVCINTHYLYIKFFIKGINGGFSEWSSWSECSASCGGGVHGRERTCTSPPPRHAGKDCKGESFETRTCNNEECGMCVCMCVCLACFNLYLEDLIVSV